MLRFAILTHDYPELHWDLLLEVETGLRTWRLQRPANENGPILALPLANHRKEYLDYEGPVSGNRGHVTRWDYGELEWLLMSPLCIRARLRGNRLQGEIQVQATELPANGDPGVWQFTCVPERVLPQ